MEPFPASLLYFIVKLDLSLISIRKSKIRQTELPLGAMQITSIIARSQNHNSIM